MFHKASSGTGLSGFWGAGQWDEFILDQHQCCVRSLGFCDHPPQAEGPAVLISPSPCTSKQE